jgi:hypothetical protein
MSLIENGQYLKCDGRHCRARARVPIGLRQTLGRDTQALNHAVSGWLFVFRDGENKHYCTDCSRNYLGNIQAKETQKVASEAEKLG